MTRVYVLLVGIEYTCNLNIYECNTNCRSLACHYIIDLDRIYFFKKKGLTFSRIHTGELHISNTIILIEANYIQSYILCS